MSQMLIRVDEEMDLALKAIYDKPSEDDDITLEAKIVVNKVYNQWKPDHEATLKLEAKEGK